MNIMSKGKKEIKWIGLPNDSVLVMDGLEAKKQQIMERIRQKTKQMQELVLQQIAYKSLVITIVLTTLQLKVSLINKIFVFIKIG